MDEGDSDAARPLLERALAIWERVLGPNHPDTATSLHNLAVLLRTQGELAAARPLQERALAIWTRALGPDHYLTARGDPGPGSEPTTGHADPSGQADPAIR